jgi:hypothetical protein
MTRYRYATTLSFGDDGEPGYTELDVEVSYKVLWGRPETPPAYSHGGLPADPDEVDDVRLELVDGKPRPWDMGYGYLTDDDFAAQVEDRFGDLWCELIAEAAQTEADRAE